MDSWDWNQIDVVHGEWWALIYVILIFLMGCLVGYFYGRRPTYKEDDEEEIL